MNTVQNSSKRTAGVLIPAFSARRKGDLGIGDTLALKDWVDWAADYGVGFLQLLPINENGAEESPYSAISSVALDPIYLALEPGEIPGLKETDLLKAHANLGEAADAPLVDYPAVRKVKRDLLELAWANFETGDQAEFRSFLAEEADWIHDYCLFRYLMEKYPEAANWDQWPECCRTPEKAREFLHKEAARDGSRVAYRLDFFAFVQWLCFRQWRALRAYAGTRGVKLMGDVPIGVSWHSCDVFFNREEFHLDWYGGSPPEECHQHDRFLQKWGQNWGIPLYRWDHMEADGFRWWRKRIARLREFFEIFRIDHILGFYRIYAFPWFPDQNASYIELTEEEAAAKNQGRLPRWFMRGDDTKENRIANLAEGDVRLRGILTDTLGAEIVGEDLGWLPDYIRPHLEGLNIAGFRIPHWDSDEHGHPIPGSSFPEPTFTTYSTHDHDPLNGIWNGCLRTIQQHHSHPDPAEHGSYESARNTLRLLCEFAEIPVPEGDQWPRYTDGIQWRLLKALFSSNSRYAALMVTELFGIEERINQPGLFGGKNWRFRMPWTMEEIRGDHALASVGEKLQAIIGITRRNGSVR